MDLQSFKQLYNSVALGANPDPAPWDSEFTIFSYADPAGQPVYLLRKITLTYWALHKPGSGSAGSTFRPIFPSGKCTRISLIF